MRKTDVSRVRLLVPVMLLLLSAGCGGGGDNESSEETRTDTAPEVADENDSASVETLEEVPDACVLFDPTELEQMLGWELRDGDPETAPPGNYTCDFRKTLLIDVTRTYPDPALPESIGFDSLTVNTYAQSAQDFNEFRELLADDAEDVSGIGDGAYFYGFDILYVLAGGKGFSLRIYTDAQTDADRALVREVMLTLARNGVARL